MGGYLRQATAAQAVALGPFVSDTDFKTVQTGLTIANTDIKLIKNGAASANKNSGGGTHRANGVYGVTFDATDTATVGEMQVSVVVAGALVVFDKFAVIEEAVYDALFAAAAPGYVANAPVNVTQFGGNNLTSAAGIPEVKVASIAASAVTASSIAADAITAAKIADGAIDAATFAAGAINAAAIAADAITDAKVAADVTIASVTGSVGSVTGAVTVGAINANVINATAIAADAITDAKVAADVTIASVTGAVGSVTGNVGGNVVGSVASVSGAVGSVTGNVGGSVASVTADVGITQGGADKVWLSAARTLTSFGTLAADAATAVWAAVARTLTSGANIVLAKGVGLTGLNDLSAAQVNTEADTALVDAGVTAVRQAHLDADVSSRLPTSGYTAPPTAANNATAVRTELGTELARIDVATSTRLAAGSYTAPDNAGIGVAAAAAASAATNASTLVGRLTSTRAGNLDNIDAAITTRAAAGDAMTLTAGERGAIADKLLGRSIAGATDGGRTMQDALRAIRNRVRINGGVLTVYGEDDTTVIWTGVASTAAGDPIVEIDPA